MCNDTNYIIEEIDENNNIKNVKYFDSQIVFKVSKTKYIKLAGSFYKNKNRGIISDDLNQVNIKTSPGEKVGKTNYNYSIDIIFKNNKQIKDKTYIIKSYPDIEKETTNMTIEVNFNDITKHLLIQRIFNNYYIVTGILFILIGIFLCFFGYYQNIMKIVVCVIFGELFTFIFFVIILGINIKWFEILFILIGAFIGILLSYYSIKYSNFYKVIISLTSGIIFGIFLIDAIFIRSKPLLIYSILVDNIIISSISFLILIKVLKKYYIFLNSIIGGYILIRGLSLLLFKSLRYRELQLIIYFMKEFEWEFFEDNNGLNWELFWVYDLLILTSIIISIMFYYFHTYYISKSVCENGTDTESEEIDNNNGNISKLIDRQSSE